MKQAVIKRLLKQEDSTLNRQFEDFAGFYGFQPMLCRPYRGQTKGKVERTVQFVRDNFMTGIKYNRLADLNGQALAWAPRGASLGLAANSPSAIRSTAGYKKTASSRTPAIRTPCPRSTSAKMWQSWPSTVC